MAERRCLRCMGTYDDQYEICPHCGAYYRHEKKDSFHLDPGIVIGENSEYIVGESIGCGGFGITYVGWDNRLNRKIAIKEFFPSKYVTRTNFNTVMVYDDTFINEYEMGLRNFIDEANRLAQYNGYEGIVHIYDCLIDKNTAYMIMDYVEGVTLMNYLKQHGPIPYQRAIRILMPVLVSLGEIHKTGLIHRDISPDNIIINEAEEKITLIDFGSARLANPEGKDGLTAIVKPGFAPLEQFYYNGNQGTWTDVYSAAAVLYHMITGKIPPSSSERINEDMIKTPTQLGYPIPQNLEIAIMNALNVNVESRTQTVDEFYMAISGQIQVQRVEPEVSKKKGEPLKPIHKMIIAASAVLCVVIVVLIVLLTGLKDNNKNGEYQLPNYENGAGDYGNDKIKKELENKGIDATVLIVGKISEFDTSKFQNSEVIKQEPEPGYTVKKGEKVDIRVSIASSGKIEKGKVPYLYAWPAKEAVIHLRNAGIENFELIPMESDDYDTNLVCDQNPYPGEPFTKDDTLKIYVSGKEIPKDVLDEKNKPKEKDKKDKEKTSKKEAATKKATKKSSKSTKTTKRSSSKKKSSKPSSKKSTKKKKSSKSKSKSKGKSYGSSGSSSGGSKVKNNSAESFE